MNNNITIILAEDDEGHALLIKRNLKRAGVVSPIIHFQNGEEVLQFFLGENAEYKQNNTRYIILLDIKMPKVDGIEVLEKLKAHSSTKKIPVIMITTTDIPHEIDICHSLGCNSYIVKPIDYKKFIEIVKRLGYYLEIIEVPNLN